MDKEAFPEGKVVFEIEELGPIKESRIDFKPFLLFSGESNTGKSYTAMAVYYLFYMLNEEDVVAKLTHKLFDSQQIEERLKEKNKIELDIPAGLATELEKIYADNIDRFMAYMLGYDDFKCKVKLKLNIPRPKDHKISIEYRRENYKVGPFFHFTFDFSDYSGGYSTANDSEFQEDLYLVVRFLCLNSILNLSFFKGLTLRKFFLPPGRGAFSGLTPSTQDEFYGVGMYKEFKKGIDSVMYPDFEIPKELKEQISALKPLFAKLLDGKIEVERDRELLSIADSGQDIPLTAASSAVKELFPLYLLLNRVPIERLSVCIEEPEAHLHPELQRIAALLLSYIVNRGGLVQATTHSDFFINQVNNLLKLHFIKENDNEAFLTALQETGIREEFVLNPKDMGAYYFEKVKDGVRAKRLEVSERGLPLKSFEGAYEKSVQQTRYLREALADDNE